MNKSKWIRDLPTTIPAKDVVAKAKKKGIKLSIAQVYVTRSMAKKKAERASQPAPKATVKPVAQTRAAVANDVADIRMEFTRIVRRIGTDEAQRLIANVLDVRASV